MQIAHEAFETLLEHMGVDLRGRNVGMAKQRLYHTQIGAVVQEVAGESMAQHVRAQICRTQTGRRRERLKFTGEVLASEMTAVAEGREQPFRSGIPPGAVRGGALRQ